MTPEKAWKQAIKAVGGKTAMARICGVSRQSIHNRPKCIAEDVLKVAEAVRCALPKPVTKHDLRPDLYPTKPKRN